MNWYSYHITPIDFGWTQLKTVKETLSMIAQEEEGGHDPKDIDVSGVRSFLANWENAKTLAKEFGWEGDFRNAPCVFWLPSETQFLYGFVFKQDNNGCTFVISPEALPWLDIITL